MLETNEMNPFASAVPVPAFVLHAIGPHRLC